MNSAKLRENYNRLIDIQCVNYLLKHFDVTAFKYDNISRYGCAGVVPIGNVTIDFTKTITDKRGSSEVALIILVSFLSTIVRKITCDLKLEITFRHYQDFYKHDVLKLEPIYLDTEAAKYGEIVPIEQGYMIEIMTTFKSDGKGKYFGFIYLFDNHIWVCLLISIIMIISVLINSTQIKCMQATIMLFKILIGQSLCKLRNLIGKQRTIFQIISFWFVFTWIINKCFTSVLLNSYIKLRPDNLYNNLDEILKKDEYFGLVCSESTERLVQLISKEKIEKWQFLPRKITTSEIENFRLLDTIKYLKQGYLVILDDSRGMRLKQELLREIPGLVILEEKYVPTYEMFFISKQVKFKKEILKLLKSGVEAGLHSNYNLAQLSSLSIRRKLVLVGFWSKLYEKLKETPSSKYIMTLKDTWPTVFITLVIGWFISILIFLAEPIHSNYF